MDGWQHSTLDYDPVADGAEETWARAVALEGWRTWHASGVWVTVGSRRVRRWALRRPCLRPWSTHNHAETCLDNVVGQSELGDERMASPPGAPRRAADEPAQVVSGAAHERYGQ